MRMFVCSIFKNYSHDLIQIFNSGIFKRTVIIIAVISIRLCDNNEKWDYCIYFKPIYIKLILLFDKNVFMQRSSIYCAFCYLYLVSVLYNIVIPIYSFHFSVWHTHSMSGSPTIVLDHMLAIFDVYVFCFIILLYETFESDH